MFGNIVFLNASKLVGFANYDNWKIIIKSNLKKKRVQCNLKLRSEKIFLLESTKKLPFEPKAIFSLV
jgi:hypothetical protein